MFAVLEGNDVTQSRVRILGTAIDTEVEGSLQKNVLNYRLALDISDVSRMAKTLQGTLSLRGNANGRMGQARLSASGAGSLATSGFARQRVTINLQAEGLPGLRAGWVRMDGRLDGAPLLLDATFKGDKARQISLSARWKSLAAKANLSIGQNSTLSGKAALALQHLSDISVFTGVAVTGIADASLIFETRGGKTDTLLQSSIRDLHFDAVAAQLVSLHGALGDVMGKPLVGLAADVRGLTAQGFKGGSRAKLDGPLERLTIVSSTDLKDTNSRPLNVNAAASLNLTSKQLTLRAADGNWRGVALKLNTPAVIDFADGLAVNRLMAHLGGGVLTATGRILPRLALTASADDVALEDFKPFLPLLRARGTFSASASLSGTIAAPMGTVSMQGRDLRAAFSSRTLPSAAFDARAQLAGDRATVTASITAGGNTRAALNGMIPLTRASPMALRASGNTDLTLLDPFVAVEGRRIRGTLTLDLSIGGTPAAPRVNGAGKLANGEIQDYARGFRLQDIAATIAAEGTRIRLLQLTGRAGRGTITGSGSVDLASPNMPMDVTVEMNDARPITSDLITTTLSGNLKLAGHIGTLTTLAGQVQMTGGEINLPENFPPEVAVLNVRRRGQPPVQPAPQSRVALNVAVRVTGPIFVRGHGMDADMGGSIHVGGTIAAPMISGGFRMNRGTYSVAGQTLNFTTGRLGFDGIGLRGRLDPTLDFVTQTVSGGVTATMTISGYASAPKIILSSSPSLPQDEVVAHLLFQQSVKQLTPLQLASIAQAVAAMGGIGGGFNPLATVRRTLGLDRLAVGSANSGNTGTQSQTTVEAGRYVARNVYVGAKQNLSGGTQTQVQVDITRRLKAQATLSAGSTAATTQGNALQDTGSSVGLSYQFEY
jgi:translocation and assembly module TamB